MVTQERQIVVHPLRGDSAGAPKRGSQRRLWWEADSRAKNHARFCLPLLMANSLGFELLSPVDARIIWAGDPRVPPTVEVFQGDPARVTTHSAEASFTVQLNVVLETPVNWFTLIKGVANERRPFQVMEGLIETWWTPANFGLVCLLCRPGIVSIGLGEPLAVAVPIPTASLAFTTTVGSPAEDLETRAAFDAKRPAKAGRNQDYLRGRNPNGSTVCPHFASAAAVKSYQPDLVWADSWIEQDVDGYWLWAESMDTRYGPYATLDAARGAMADYAKRL